jgi:23S rRNA pseudouridine2605 synthase
LDFHTSGALLLSNDGEFVNGLLHPRYGVRRIYVTKVRGAVSDVALERWRQRIVVDGRQTQPAVVRRLRIENDHTWLEVELGEGRNQHVRRLAEHAGFPVLRLSRLTFAGIGTEGLKPGQWRTLTPDELVELKAAYGVPKRVRVAERPAKAKRAAPAARRPASERRAAERKPPRRRGR